MDSATRNGNMMEKWNIHSTRRNTTQRSYKRSQVAVSSGKFDAEIIPIEVPQWKGQSILFSIDEEPFNVTFEKIPTLKSAFVKEGSVTAANSSTMNDGAAAIILADLENTISKNSLVSLPGKPLLKNLNGMNGNGRTKRRKR